MAAVPTDGAAAVPMDLEVAAVPMDGVAAVPTDLDLAAAPMDGAAVGAGPMDVFPFRPPESEFPPSPKSRSLLRLHTRC